MNKEDIITLDDDKEYIILDILNQDNVKYLYCVGIDKDDMPTSEYVYLKYGEEDGESYLEEIIDEKLLSSVITMFAANYLNEEMNEEQED